ncbi:hypothetical protein EHQ92_16970 [Leptospira biflexa]|jgi:hypothetical protein|uniref:Uncharacterized protein n=4 Tax=Leptospiraceae TaxID=170 RepID=B0SMM6_LEPBP|nr:MULTISPECIES: hypothetical protein [Leptospira]ABZ95074.1 Hypothetical protein LBF_2590 [Leptospira biflexa serovar Patoc strain 'Patoc 1 (Ames)']ABZ98750.1 Conserved hypothetical protein [Leptospira biflexa serovar Patoc strain 'Patoc 1 (Paris)']TGL20028.1 hypothetical protein EHQ46_11605 [Leptospira yanagawae]EOQ88618.1 hypothetical protein LEP1GSC202_2688 [Leptospira yanagawae serovar Saopaulo str. Sao Paulo = ATCC 700523]TGM33744.1 hypothetical protein EHQ80_16000 [Leptospira biflexa]
MEMELSLEQYETLLKLVYMGDWVISTLQAKDRSEDEPDSDSRYADVVRHVFSQAEHAGLGNIVQIDQNNGEPYLTREFEEESGLVDILEDYEDEVFWQALIERLAHRDFLRHFGETAISQMAIEERIEKETPFHDKWATEFHENGLENIKT